MKKKPTDKEIAEFSVLLRKADHTYRKGQTEGIDPISLEIRTYWALSERLIGRPVFPLWPPLPTKLLWENVGKFHATGDPMAHWYDPATSPNPANLPDAQDQFIGTCVCHTVPLSLDEWNEAGLRPRISYLMAAITHSKWRCRWRRLRWLLRRFWLFVARKDVNVWGID